MFQAIKAIVYLITIPENLPLMKQVKSESWFNKKLNFSLRLQYITALCCFVLAVFCVQNTCTRKETSNATDH